MKTSKRTRPKCSVESHGRSWRVRYRVGGDVKRKQRPLPSEELARFAADLIERGLNKNPTIDPYPLIKDVISLYAAQSGDQPVQQVAPPPVDMKRQLDVKEWYDVWLQMRKPNCRPSNYNDYQYHSTYFLPHLGHIQVAKLTVHDLVRCRAALLSGGKTGKQLSTKTVKNIMLGSLKRMLRDARTHEVMTHNPFDHDLFREWPETNNPVDQGPQADPFTVDEKAKVLATVRRRYWGDVKLKGLYAYVLTLMNVPFRPSEASGLNWSDLDLANARAQVLRSYSSGALVPPKTKSSRRPVMLPPEVVEVLRQIQPLNVSPDDPVFVNRDGQRIDRKHFSPTWNGCLRAAGVRQRGIYAAKDTAITLARLAGCSWAFLEAQSGVAERTLTKHYFAFLPQEQPNEFQKFAEWERDRLGATQPQPHQAQIRASRKAR
ncbi:site-specific integrase [Candidatus Binatia bacterium]|nr:site-specific integrase [Microbacteriaceae bacterium]MBY0280459.1 site-specific integrase [Candidatus Binatia bacterium]